MMSSDVTPGVLVLAEDEGGRIDLSVSRVRIKASGAQTGGAFSLLYFQLQGGEGGPPLHRHDFVETIYVLDGVVTVQMEDETVQADASTTVIVPSGAVHTFGNRAESPATFLLMFSPPGFEQWFVDIAELVERNGQVEPADLGALSQRYGVEFVEEAGR